jgi:hypothetical protein
MRLRGKEVTAIRVVLGIRWIKPPGMAGVERNRLHFELSRALKDDKRHSSAFTKSEEEL